KDTSHGPGPQFQIAAHPGNNIITNDRLRLEILVYHVDLAHPAPLACGIDEPAQLFAARLGPLHVAHDQLADAGGLVARCKADRSDSRELVEQAEIHPHILDAIKLDFVDRLEHDPAPHDQSLGRDLEFRGHAL